ncbi:H-NS histone family protein [Paraburkholderia strydomiana]|uniref:H-NS histone family protein n=1 Tax=Paraburkholderia strydomiana TaxID=1245417 RepID=UPI001BE8E12D|nr:H-NS family nucleoid-associated regulatory protein [Paraburkholderia strydomiana]MBT2789106.1 H-NS histone family protein [Paraburkholderia strydomiana]
MDERKRDSMIAYLRHRMDDFGISPDDLASFLATASDMGRYRSAGGDTWSGEGETPQWLTQAINAGQSIGHFELPWAALAQPATRSDADCKDDPFAGSPLARSNHR